MTNFNTLKYSELDLQSALADQRKELVVEIKALQSDIGEENKRYLGLQDAINLINKDNSPKNIGFIPYAPWSPCLGSGCDHSSHKLTKNNEKTDFTRES